MAKKIAVSSLNASTINILNVIRQNASADYQANVPVVTKAADIPAVGDVIYGTPAFANQFLTALINRISLVVVQSATFNNPYKRLKKGYLEFGETVEDIFVNIANVVDFSAEKAEEREFKRSIPDVKSVFHTMNWRVMYPVTIQDEDLKRAFLSMDGVQDLISRIVDSVYTAAEYDEFLLIKYMLIKAVNKGAMQIRPFNVGNSLEETLKNSAVVFRSVSNILPFMGSTFNQAGVKTTTPKNRQVIFMDATFNASFDVNVLASAFNMDKANFMGSLFLIDTFSDFDNDRFELIRKNSTGLEEVTIAELAKMSTVNAIILDENWFQIYDNNNKFTEKYVASGLYWNYFYHTWKTVSYSPFANAVAFVYSDSPLVNGAAPQTVRFKITSVDVTRDGDIPSGTNTIPGLPDSVTIPAGSQSRYWGRWAITLTPENDETIGRNNCEFTYDGNATIACMPVGALFATYGYRANSTSDRSAINGTIGANALHVTAFGKRYTCASQIDIVKSDGSGIATGTVLTFTKDA